MLSPKDYTISPKAAQMLVEFLGTDLSKINNELENKSCDEEVMKILKKILVSQKIITILNYAKQLGIKI